MKFPVHSLETVQGQMTYGYSRDCGKWMFKVGTFCWLIDCHGGEQGHKVARIIVGSLRRSGKLDGLANSNIKKIIK